jgi:hypothetical protein
MEYSFELPALRDEHTRMSSLQLKYTPVKYVQTLESAQGAFGGCQRLANQRLGHGAIGHTEVNQLICTLSGLVG